MNNSGPVLNCPVCGAAVPVRIQFVKLAVCEHCKTTLFLQDDAVKHVGKKSMLTQMPSIFELSKRYQHRSWTFETCGRIQFDYDGGMWDEWWVVSPNGENKWLSVDEGDIVLEAPFEGTDKLADFDQINVGQEVKIDGRLLIVTEKNTSRCIAVEGQLPDLIFPGKVHNYIHLSGPNGTHYTFEYVNKRVKAYKGVWIDPFDVKAL